MNTLSEFFKSKRINHSRGIQKALRRLDAHILALSLINIERNEREILYRNTTKRVENMIEKEIEMILFHLKNNDTGIDESSITDAENMVVEELLHWTNEKIDTPFVYPENLPDVKLDSFRNILNTFISINDQCRKYGMFSINGIENKTDNVLFQKGFELIVDGTDPLLVEEIMGNYIKSLSNDYLRRLNIIWNAIKLIQLGSPSDLIIEKLKSLKNA